MPAEVSITLGSVPYEDGATFEFGPVRWGAATVVSTERGFIVHNTGSSTLTIGELTVDGNLTLPSSVANRSIPPGGAALLTIRVNAMQPGDFAGHISFTTNDPDENPFDLAIHWTVILGDLTASGVSIADATPDPGQAVAVGFRIDNVGDESIGGFYNGIYLSTDSVISTDDIQIGSYTGIGLGPHGFALHSETVTIPEWVTPGATYYIGVIADYTGIVAERDNGNNSSPAVAIVIPGPASDPDLGVSNLDASETALHPGDSITVTYRVFNSGPGPAGPSNTWIGMYDDAGRYWDFETRAVGEIASDGARYVTATITMPGDLPSGTYHLAAIADSTGDVAELNEDNNWSNLIDLTVTARPVVTDHVDGNGHRTMRTVVYEDGRFIRFGFDAQDRLDWMEEHRADGSLQYHTDWDQAGDQTWTQSVDYFATDGSRREQKFTTYDDGAAIRLGFDAEGRQDWQQELRADGSLEFYTDWDQAGDQSWLVTRETYGPDGSTRLQKLTEYNDSTSIRLGYDQHGHIDWQQEMRPDGSLEIYTDWDQDNLPQNTWTSFVRYFDADGVTALTTHVYFDAGGDLWL